jgi:hypothetical protein
MQAHRPVYFRRFLGCQDPRDGLARAFKTALTR